MTSPSTYKLGYPKLSYSVVPMASGAPFQRDPTTSDLLDPKVGSFYKIGTVWPNSNTGGAFMLGSITGGDTANWYALTEPSSGDVSGPASSVVGTVAVFNNASGKSIGNSSALITGSILTGIGVIGLGIAPTSRLTIAAGTATAGTAPLKLTLGVNLTSAEAGAIEYDGTYLYYTDSNPTRNALAVAPGTSTANSLVSFSGTSGYKLLSNTPTISSGVITFPAGGGNVLTGGGSASRKGTFSLTGGSSGAIATSAAVTGSVIAVTVVSLGTVTVASSFLVTINTGVGFTLTASQNNDTSTGTWAIVA